MERQAHAGLRLRQQRQRFFGNPLNLLLPFTVGALLSARLRARPASGTRKARGTSLGKMLRTGLALWSASEGLRRSLGVAAGMAAVPPGAAPSRDA